MKGCSAENDYKSARKLYQPICVNPTGLIKPGQPHGWHINPGHCNVNPVRCTLLSTPWVIQSSTYGLSTPLGAQCCQPHGLYNLPPMAMSTPRGLHIGHPHGWDKFTKVAWHHSDASTPWGVALNVLSRLGQAYT